MISQKHKKNLANAKTLFLLQFTKELIRHSSKDYMLKLEHSLKRKAIQEREHITKKINLRLNEKRNPEIRNLRRMIPSQQQIRNPSQIQTQKKLVIPESKLPENLQYLRPTPRPINIDLGKINPYIQNPSINTIECNGPGKNIRTISRGITLTETILTKEEINQIIDTFSKLSRIPVTEGIYRVIVGNLKLTAIISEITGSKFIIKKLLPPPQRMLPR